MAYKDRATKREAERRHYAANKSVMREKKQRYRDANRATVTDFQRRWRLANPEKQSESKRRYRESHPEQMAKESKSRWDGVPQAERNEAVRRSIAANPEKAKEQSRRKRQKNADTIRASNRRRQAIKRAATVEPYRDDQIFDRDCWRCQLCGQKIDKRYRSPHRESPSIDHVIPLSLGGADSPANVQAAHLGCNIDKKNRALPRGEQLRFL